MQLPRILGGGNRQPMERGQLVNGKPTTDKTAELILQKFVEDTLVQTVDGATVDSDWLISTESRDTARVHLGGGVYNLQSQGGGYRIGTTGFRRNDPKQWSVERGWTLASEELHKREPRITVEFSVQSSGDRSGGDNLLNSSDFQFEYIDRKKDTYLHVDSQNYESVGKVNVAETTSSEMIGRVADETWEPAKPPELGAMAAQAFESLEKLAFTQERVRDSLPGLEL